MGERLAAYRRLLAAQIRSQTQYRASFVMESSTSALFALFDVLSVLVLFRVTPRLGGFSPAEVFLMAGLAMVGFAIADLSVGNVERLRMYVRTGLLDAVLLRPLGVLPQLVAIDFAPRRIGRLVQSVLVLSLALSFVHIDWSPARVLMVVVAPLTGAMLFGALFVAGASVAFWWIESGELANAFTYGGRDFTLYPTSVYTGLFRHLFGYALGFAFVAYYPVLVLLGRPDPLGAPWFVPWFGPPLAALLAVAAGLLWRAGVRHYRSTGS